MSAQKNKWEFVQLLCCIDLFDLEERKQVREIIVDIYLANKGIIEPLFAESGDEIIETMLSKYGDKNMCHFVGPFLRIYTSSPILVKSICKMEHLMKLKDYIIKPNFVV